MQILTLRLATVPLRTLLLLPLLLGLATGGPLPAAQAAPLLATFTVNTSDDNDDGA